MSSPDNPALRALWRNLMWGTGWATLMGLVYMNPRSFALSLFGWMIGTAAGVYVTHGKI